MMFNITGVGEEEKYILGQRNEILGPREEHLQMGGMHRGANRECSGRLQLDGTAAFLCYGLFHSSSNSRNLIFLFLQIRCTHSHTATSPSTRSMPTTRQRRRQPTIVPRSLDHRTSIASQLFTLPLRALLNIPLLRTKLKLLMM